jgi:GYF domain 2
MAAPEPPGKCENSKMDQWYITRDEVKKGPFSFAQLQAAAAKGAVRDTDKLLQAGGQQWVAARQVSGLFPALPAKPEIAIPAEVPGAAPVAPARPTESRSAVVVGSSASAAIRRFKEGDWLRVTRDFLERSVASIEASPLFQRAGTSRPQAWQRIAAVSIGLFLLVVVPFLIFGRQSRPSHTADSAAFRPADLELPPVSPAKLPAPDVVMQEFKAARAIYRAAMRKARADLLDQYPRVRAEIEKSDLNRQEKTRSLARLGNEQGKFAIVEIFGGGAIPTHPAMKTAVADYLLACASARRALGEVAAKGLIAYEKAGVTDRAKLRPLQAARLEGEHTDLMGIWEGTLPEVQVPDGVFRSCRQVWHIGVDERSADWLVSGFDARHGAQPGAAYLGQNVQFKDGALTFVAAPVELPSFRIGIQVPGQRSTAGSGARFEPRFIFAPNFAKRPEAPQTGPSVKPADIVVTLKPHDGELRCEPLGNDQPAEVVFHRTDEERCHTYFDRYEKNWTVRRWDTRPDAFDVSNANDVWRRVAQLASFACYPSSGWIPLEHEAIYLPYRRANPNAAPPPPPRPGAAIEFGADYSVDGLYGAPRRSASAPRTDSASGSTPGARARVGRAEALLLEYEDLSPAPHPYLKRMTDQAALICRRRIQLAGADEQFGNTAASAMRQFGTTVLAPAIQYGIEREADISAARDQVQRDYPNYHFIVSDAPMSEASREKWGELIKGVGNIKEDIKQRGVVSGLLAYADMAQVDLAVAFWQTWLLPLARRCGGPVSGKPLVNVQGAWAWSSKRDFQRLKLFQLLNVSGQDLTHVVLELIAENEWGEKAAHYYYFDLFDVGDYVYLAPHPRWEKRRLDFTNTITLKWSLWADEASETGGEVKLTSPMPNPDPAGWRADYLKQDQQYQAEGEAVGAFLASTITLPFIPERQRRLLRDAAAPQKSYAFRLQGEANRTLVLRFLRFDRNHDTFEAELFDLGTRKAFDPQTSVWKGKLNARPEAGISFGKEAGGTESGWAFTLARDEKPMLSCPDAGKPGAVFPARDILLFAVEVP